MSSSFSIADESTVGGRRAKIVGRVGDLGVSRSADLSALPDQSSC